MINKPEHNEPFSVLIPDGESFFALPTLQCLGRERNIKIYVLADDPWASIRYSRYTKQFFSFPKESGDEGRLNAITDIVKKKKIDIILPIDEPTIRFLAEKGKELLKYTTFGPIPKPETFDIVTNKWLFYNWLYENNFPTPPTILYQSNDKFKAALSSFSFPALIKPAKGNGGIGIKFFNDSISLISYCEENIGSQEFVVQSYIKGYDIGCSVLCQDGVIIGCTFQKRASYEPLMFSASTNIDFLFDSQVFEVIKEIIKKLNWTGYSNFDLRYDENDKKVRVLEINARFWQTILGSYYAGVNFPYLATLLGLKRDLPEINFKHIHYVNPQTTIKILVKRVFQHKKSVQHFDHSKLETHLRDPLPIIANKFFKICRKIGAALHKKTK